MHKLFIVNILFMLSAAAWAADSAQDFPSKPIRVMGQGVGSTADYLSRYVGQKLTEQWGQTVVVDNRAGAGGTISTDVVAKATPDGYTLVMGHAGTHVSAVSLYKSLPYDPIKDFAPISLVAKLVTVLVVHPSVPANNVQELIAYAKQKGDLNYASAGNGTISHLTGELFNQVAGLKIQHVPYKSAGAALTGLIGGETPVSFLSPITAHTQLKAGKLKAFAVSSRTRFVAVPDIPSATEAGIPGMEAVLWFGLFAPAQTPKPIVAKLNQTVVEILSRPDVKAAILVRGGEVAPSTPDELAAWVKSEIKKWTPIIKAAGIQAG
jgi:tripartite-type tricarboxylate transporter receptor subunit TctC